MSNINTNHNIRIMEYITQKEYDQIYKLMKLCCEQEQINLKLELDYKLHLGTIAAKSSPKATQTMNEFLYYIDEELVSYLGISCFDGKTGELCGMTHPKSRDKGLFHRLLALAANEGKHSPISKYLILADGSSISGMKFITSVGSNPAHSEYRMKMTTISNTVSSEAPSVTLRLACKEDEKELARQNALFFNEGGINEETGEYEITPLEDAQANFKNYMIELEGTIIGKINVEYYEDSAFICGFGILPEYRRNGCGRAAMKQTLSMIKGMNISIAELDVVCTNKNALNLYKDCGFEEISVMNYYEFTV